MLNLLIAPRYLWAQGPYDSPRADRGVYGWWWELIFERKKDTDAHVNQQGCQPDRDSSCKCFWTTRAKGWFLALCLGSLGPGLGLTPGPVLVG